MNGSVQDFNAQNIRDAIAGKQVLDLEEMTYSELSASPKRKQDIVTDVRNALANAGNSVTYEVAEQLVTSALDKLKKSDKGDNVSRGMWARK